jgi:hypothetical protein
MGKRASNCRMPAWLRRRLPALLCVEGKKRPGTIPYSLRGGRGCSQRVGPQPLRRRGIRFLPTAHCPAPTVCPAVELKAQPSLRTAERRMWKRAI